jgi:hypothetical protein
MMNLTIPIPDWVVATQKRLEATSPEEVLVEELLRTTTNAVPHLIKFFAILLPSWSAGGNPHPEARKSCWSLACTTLSLMIGAQEIDRLFPHRSGSQTPDAHELRVKLDALRAYRSELRDLMRLVIVARPEWDLPVPEELEGELWTYHISPLAYLRAMWNLFWSAVRHPLSNTTIDLSTGRVVCRT